MTVKDTKFDQLDKLYNLLDNRLSLIETGISTLHKDIEKLNDKVEDLVERGTKSEKDIEYMQKEITELKSSIKENFDILWEQGIRKTKTDITSLCDNNKKTILEVTKSMVDKRALKERLALYGAVIAALAAFLKSLL